MWDKILLISFLRYCRTITVEVQHSNATQIDQLLTSHGFVVLQRAANVDVVYVRKMMAGTLL